MTRIQDIQAREILGPGGIPALEADVTLQSGALGRAVAPSGLAGELRDGGSRFAGQGLRQACAQINERLALYLQGQDALDQRAIDQHLTSLPDLGTNVTLALSLAIAQAAAFHLDLPLHRYLGGIPCALPPKPLVSLPPSVNLPSHVSHAWLLPLDPSWSAMDALQAATELSNALAGKGLSEAFMAERQRLGYAPDQLGLALECPRFTQAMNAPEALPVKLLITEDEQTGLAIPQALRKLPSDGSRSHAQLLDLRDAPTLTDFFRLAQQARAVTDSLILDAQAPGTDPALAAELATAIQAMGLMAGDLEDLESVARYNQLIRMA